MQCLHDQASPSRLNNKNPPLLYEAAVERAVRGHCETATGSV